MNAIRRWCCRAAITWALMPLGAHAGIPVDSFDSASAALAPSVAVDRGRSTDDVEHLSTRGPADALVRLARRDRKSRVPPAASPAAADDQRRP